MLNMQDEVYEQGSQAWLDIRKKSITATDMSTIMGVNPWCTPSMLFELKLGYRTVEENNAMREGTRLEPYARAKLQELFHVELNPKVCFHAQFKHHMASLDAVDDGLKFLSEIKCSKKYHDQAKDGTIPDHVKPQCQWQMHVTGANSMYYYAFYEGSGILIPVARDDVYIKGMIIKAEEFYKCLQTLEPPLLTSRDIVQREDPEFLNYAHGYKIATMALKEAQENQEYWRNKLINLAGESCAEGGDVKVTRYFRKGNIDFKEVIDKNCPSVCLDDYRGKTTVSWRIT